MAVRLRIITTWGKLAEVAEKSPGYSVSAVGDDGQPVEISNISFGRRNGRRQRGLVLADYSYAGITKNGRFDGNGSICIFD